MKAQRQDKVAGERAHAEQMRQRVRVGMIGLAAVVLLIGVASAIFSSVNREAPVDGAGNVAAIGNLSAPGAAPSPSPGNEPLAEMGVTPATANTPIAGAAPAAK